MLQTDAIHRSLKMHLRRKGKTYADVATVLELSEASVKRLFSTSGLSIERLEKICDLLGTDVSDVVADSRKSRELITELTSDQERALLEQPDLLLVTFLVLNRVGVDEILAHWKFTRPELIRRLAELERWGLIDLLPFDHIRVRAARHFTWRRAGVVQTTLGRDVLLEFLETHFDAEGEKMRFASGMLSDASIARVHTLMDEFLAEVDSLVEADQDLGVGQRKGVAMFTGFRPWVFSAFTQFKR